MLKDLSGGIQSFLLRFKLLGQAGNVLFIWLIIAFCVTNGVWLYFKTTHYDYYLIEKLVEAKADIKISHIYEKLGSDQLAKAAKTIHFEDPFGEQRLLPAEILLKDASIIEFIQHIKNILYLGFLVSLFSSLSFILLISTLIKSHGKKSSEEKHIRGSGLVEIDTLKSLISNAPSISDYQLGGISLPKNSEVQHILLIGSPGSGKTVCISDFLQQIRNKSRRAIVYDKMGIYTKRFYRPGKDIILNPLDERCPPWNVWAECHTATHFDTMAESLIPMPTKGQDPFWIMAARIVFSVAARRLKEKGELSTPRLLRYLLMADLNRIQELIANTEAESLASEKAEKMALSVKAVLTTYLKSMRYLTDSPNPFSIRDWIAKEEDDSWIFLTSRGDQHATLKPLISTFLDVASNAILSLKPNPERRIHFVCDETDSLQYMPSLLDFTTQGRQFGSCALFSVQAISQFFKNFGEDDAETIISCCNTGIYFRSRGKVTAPYVADLLGEEEIEEVNENISYGTGGNKESVSMNRHRSIKRLILPSQIKRLEDLEAYLQLKGDLPITKIKFKFKQYPENVPAFIPREIVVDVELNNAMNKIITESRIANVKDSETSSQKTTKAKAHKHQMVGLE